ncbi:carbohydrate kinase family protein [Thermoflavimicrobium dichotomicum]|uniref:Sugar or nucleoside kinase, ribokinase family n=1 Tax=Thermoflavimicrobium dichotomicum TaxID=46223 RepID=A0A1I3V384_9BACL|nr:carbohydrate kinase family protein [Thermoflavimicrobium dichotomicum]SFJ88647.1 Sugar or nucleoside kinase, ribokinase family [Thermoflavimicrobium dichotomicum]
MATNVAVDVIVAGNVCLDLFPSVQQDSQKEWTIIPGRLLQVGPVTTATGGAVPNTGIALHRLGISTRLIGKVGDDWFGQRVLDLLQQQSPRLVEDIIVSSEYPTSYTIVISSPHLDRIFFHCSGVYDTFDSSDIPYASFQGAKIFHLGYPPLIQSLYLNEGKELEKIFCEAKKQNLFTSLDMAMPDPSTPAAHTDWSVVLQHVLPYVDLFIPSLEEILFMIEPEQFQKMKADSEYGDLLPSVDGTLIEQLSRKLLHMGAAMVAIKLGEHGLYVRTSSDPSRLSALRLFVPSVHDWTDRELLAPCYEVKVMGTTGAGDCTIAGFLAGLIHCNRLEQVLSCATAVGACCVEQTDATSGIPSWAEVQARIMRGWKKRGTCLHLPEWIWDEEQKVWIGPHDPLRKGKR